MSYLIGVLLAIAIGAFATLTRLDRDRAFYPVVMIVIALLYALFAAMGNMHDPLPEIIGIVIFVALAMAGFRRSLWFVVVALAGHGVFDAFHARLMDNPGVPTWWPAFCLAYDVMAAGYLAWLLASGRLQSGLRSVAGEPQRQAVPRG